MEKDTIDELATRVIGAAIEVHRNLGPGLLESAYRLALCHEISGLGLPFETEKALPVRYKGIQLDCGYRLDLVIANKIILELKTVESLAPIHDAQLLSYMRLGGYALGYLINFHVRLLKNGIKRLILT